jgi:hypothetical protein
MSEDRDQRPSTRCGRDFFRGPAYPRRYEPSAVYCSDRPERVAGHLTTEQFVDDCAVGPNSFDLDPPKTMLTLPSLMRPPWTTW